MNSSRQASLYRELSERLLQSVPAIPHELSTLESPEFALCIGFFRRDKGYHIAVESWKNYVSPETTVQLVIAGPAIDDEGRLYL